MFRKKIFKFGDKVSVYSNDDKGVVTKVMKIRNDSGDKYLDYSYQVSFEDDTYIELSGDDMYAGWTIPGNKYVKY